MTSLEKSEFINGSFYTSYDLNRDIQTIGKDKIRFIVPMKVSGTLTPLGFMTSSSDPDTPVECKIDEQRYKVEDNYKISLTPSDYKGYIEHYYVSDLASLISTGYISIIR